MEADGNEARVCVPDGLASHTSSEALGRMHARRAGSCEGMLRRERRLRASAFWPPRPWGQEGAPARFFPLKDGTQRRPHTGEDAPSTSWCHHCAVLEPHWQAASVRCCRQHGGSLELQARPARFPLHRAHSECAQRVFYLAHVIHYHWCYY